MTVKSHGDSRNVLAENKSRNVQIASIQFYLEKTD